MIKSNTNYSLSFVKLEERRQWNINSKLSSNNDIGNVLTLHSLKGRMWMTWYANNAYHSHNQYNKLCYQCCSFEFAQGHYRNISTIVMLYWKVILTVGSTNNYRLVTSDSTSKKNRMFTLCINSAFTEYRWYFQNTARKWKGALRGAQNGKWHKEMLSKTRQWAEYT